MGLYFFDMARIRTIKPEFWTSAQIVECSPTARLLFIGMWNFADDRGVIPANPKEIKMKVMPGDDFTSSQIYEFLVELEKQKLIRKFNSDNTDYYVVTGWNHQKIEKPSFKYPVPKFDDHSTTIPQLFDDGPPAEGNGKEGIVKDRKGKDSKGGKVVDKSPTAQNNYFDLIEGVFQKCYKESRGFDYHITNKGKESAAISKLVQIYKKERPGVGTQTALVEFEQMFTQCLAISETWLYEGMSLPIIASQFNKIKAHINNQNNGNGKPKQTTSEDVDRAVDLSWESIYGSKHL